MEPDEDDDFDCPACGGSGGGDDAALRCPACRGTGMRDREPSDDPPQWWIDAYLEREGRQW